MKSTVELLPKNLVGLRVTVGVDGVWLHFSTDEGKYASFHADELINKLGGSGFFGQAVRAWVLERQEQAKQMEALKL